MWVGVEVALGVGVVVMGASVVGGCGAVVLYVGVVLLGVAGGWPMVGAALWWVRCCVVAC